MTNEERWITFITELRAYVEEHHHFPNKHTSMLNAIKYTRKKIREGTLEEWKVEQFSVNGLFRFATRASLGRDQREQQARIMIID